MKRHNIYSSIAIAAVLGLTACEKESTFLYNEGEGMLNCETLSVDYINSGKEVRAGGVSVNDFTVNFVKVENGTESTVKSYTYGEMPQVVSLPKGRYKAEASFGDNPVAEWEAPYYLGNTSFDIKEGEITNDVEPVECELSNMRIRVNIDDLGLGLVGSDAKVVVTAGNQGMLVYDQTTNDKSGYFRFVDGSQTIVASFSGTVGGVKIDNIRRYYDNANPGNAYRVNLVITKPDNTEPGNINITDGGIQVDATIEIVDENKVIDPNEPDDNILVDDMRPVEDPVIPDNPDDPNDPNNPNNPDDPNNPNNPDNPDDPTPPAAKGPQIEPLSSGLVLNECSEVSECKFKVTSETGITEFKIEIDSPALTPSELEGIGLAAELDLINPGDKKGPLEGFGFAVGENVKNQKEVEFDITQFLRLLQVFGPMDHKFHLTITDANGTTKGFIGLRFK